MFKHLFILIWNKKRQNLLLMVEMLISFLVVFALFTLMVFYYQNYRKPLGCDYENIWAVTFTYPVYHQYDSVATFYEGLQQTIQSCHR
jgi:putative ABC transport system permease protein